MKVTEIRTYYSLNDKWNGLRPKVTHFFGTYANVVRRTQSGAIDEDYIQQALEEYHVEYGVPFTLLHAWIILKVCPKWKDVKILRVEEAKQHAFKKFKVSESTTFNTLQSTKDSFNLNQMAEYEDEKEEEVQEVRPLGRDKAKNKALASYVPSTSSAAVCNGALAKLLLNEFTSQQSSFMSMKKIGRNAFLKIKRHEMKMEQKKFELQQQMFDFQQQKQRQEGKLFYMSSVDHLSGVHFEKVLLMKKMINEKYNLDY